MANAFGWVVGVCGGSSDPLVEEEGVAVDLSHDPLAFIVWDDVGAECRGYCVAVLNSFAIGGEGEEARNVIFACEDECFV